MADNFLTNFTFSSFINIISANNKVCPDQVVGQLYNGNFQFNQNRINIDYVKINNMFSISNKLTEPIIIILESPHIDEFANGIALGPAMGKTGKYFGKFFDSLIINSKNINLQLQQKYDVIFVNAIQYQCSLGNKLNGKGTYQNKKQRDQNWLTCFNNSNSNDLKDRITAIKPYAVINLCTIGINNLQLYVDRILNSLSNYTIGNHPSTWVFRKGVIQ